ncbi:unnamed protein product [Calicophoron daubneyi]|uniref:Uncharacterized protein n=1 Tax=Calicophoron daubneyi TaxID=300641 RepID=A0AAV2TDM4_CALDB
MMLRKSLTNVVYYDQAMCVWTGRDQSLLQWTNNQHKPTYKQKVHINTAAEVASSYHLFQYARFGLHLL